MKKTIIFLGLILVANALFATITVDGNAYLENQTDHSGIEVFFERTAPSSLTYTVYTNASGYYTADIETGIYDITYSKDEFFNEWLYDQSLFSNTTLSDITLIEHTTILNVPAQFISIQTAIDYAFNADTVLVQPGTYFENINYNGKNITVASLYLTTTDTSYISQTIIDGNQNGSVVTFNGGSDNAVLSGFTIQNGSGSYGGGICCFDSSPSLVNVTITGNTADYYGGGIYCWDSSPSLENITITGNSAGSRGGGIYCEGSSPSLENVTITSNSAGSGGGIYCEEDSNPSLENVKITGNSTDYGRGGGIYCRYGSNLSLKNVTISSNSASDGGGISCSSSPSLENVTITNNTASGNGGGIWCYNSSPSLVNSIVSDNTGNYGIYVISGNPSITHSDFYNNENGNFYNCGEWVGVNVMTNTNGDSCDVYFNIQLDPLFEDPANGDYHLTENSPCIDAGDPTSSLDPDGTIADMGAFFYDQSGIIYPPLADFVADITEGYAPLTVNFTDLSTQGSVVIDEWYWDFGDGNNSSLQDPANEYLLPGIYTVSLTVTDENDSTDTETKIDYITVFGNDPPSPPTNVQINISGDDVILNWAVVDTTIYGTPIEVDYYVIYQSDEPNGNWQFSGATSDTTYTHNYVAYFSNKMFYRVVSFVGTRQELEEYVERYLRKPEGKYLIER